MTNSTKFDECLALQIEKRFGIIDENDLQMEYNFNNQTNNISDETTDSKIISEKIVSRAGYKRKRSCKITKYPKVLHKVCCSKSKCNKWTKS